MSPALRQHVRRTAQQQETANIFKWIASRIELDYAQDNRTDPINSRKEKTMPLDVQTDRLLRMNRERLRAPLSWVATTPEQPYTNFGDGLSAIMVSSLAGMPVVRANFDEDSERIVAVGTIGHGQKNGKLHFWGTGVDALRNPVTGDAPYSKPPNTEFNVYATRGPNSAATFRNAGIDAPDIFGDPVWLLPRIWPLDDVEKTHDLGVILHISELTEQGPGVGHRPEYGRYDIPEEWAGKVKIINTYCDATPDAMRAKVAEIVSCRRIVSTSLHGLVISETYGIHAPGSPPMVLPRARAPNSKSTIPNPRSITVSRTFTRASADRPSTPI